VLKSWRKPPAIKEAVLPLSRVALLYHTDLSVTIVRAAEAAARSLSLTTHVLSVSGVPDFENVFELARKDRAGAIQVLPSAWFNTQRAQIIELAAGIDCPRSMSSATTCRMVG